MKITRTHLLAHYVGEGVGAGRLEDLVEAHSEYS